MNGTTEGIQAVGDFLPQKPSQELEPNDASEVATPVTKPESMLPGFPSEPRIDAPAVSQDEPWQASAPPIGEVNIESYQQNALLPTNGDGPVRESVAAAQVEPTNGVSPPSVDEKPTAENLGIPSPRYGADEMPSPKPPVPPSDSLPPQEASILSPPLLTEFDISRDSSNSTLLPSHQPVELSPPLDQAPTSDLREIPQSVAPDSDAALRVKSEKHQADLARDSDLAESGSTGGDAPIVPSLESSTNIYQLAPSVDSLLADQPTSTKIEDTPAADPPTMLAPSNADILSQSPSPPPAPAVVPLEQPAAPAPTPSIDSTLEPAQQTDQIMTDAPLSQPKQAREREEDTVEVEPAAKRAKTEDQIAEPDFKVPDLPPTTQSPAPMNGEFASSNIAPADRMTAARIKHLNKGIQSQKKVQCSRFFKNPVDYVAMKIPNYPEIVKEPMDLSTMETKLKSGAYSTISAFKSDAEVMVNNAIKFNGPDHMVVKEGRQLLDNLYKSINSVPDPEFEEPSRAEKKAQKVKIEPTRAIPARRPSASTAGPAGSPSASSANQTFALTPDGVPLIRRDSTVTDGRPKRAIHPPKRRDDLTGARPKKKKFEWQLKFCKEVLTELKKPKHYAYAQYFYFPVDPVALNIPSYHSVIKKPMDLQTVENKLNGNEYEKAKDFEDDVRQIFKNCFKFNVKGDHVFNAGEQCEKVFTEKWAQKDSWIEDHEPTSGPMTPGSESEEDEEEEEEESADDSENERAEKLAALQKQIDWMSKQMGELAQPKKKKKPTPPVPAKKTKKSSVGEKSKKSSATFPALSGSTTKKEKTKTKPKPEKERFVTYNEKQYISSGISSLPDNRMSEALRIIQSNVPALKDTHETEIELDIDELPNSVLFKLLDFVKKHVPQAPPAPEPERAYTSTATTKTSSKPKKNKPMSKHEQEAQIEELKGRLGRYGEGQMSPDPVQSIEQGDSSGDESDSEESEEE